MNELDALRQEAETLKNAIRVSIFRGMWEGKQTFRGIVTRIENGSGENNEILNENSISLIKIWLRENF